jgi:hypothetical protein
MKDWRAVLLALIAATAIVMIVAGKVSHFIYIQFAGQVVLTLLACALAMAVTIWVVASAVRR